MSASLRSSAPATGRTEGQAASVRLKSVDAFRGAAIAGVVVFHLVWDLDYTGLALEGLARHPAWVLFGRTIAGSFMFLVGVNLVLAHPAGVRWRPFAKRLLVIAIAAAAITAATAIAFPRTFVYFGILHAIAAASLTGALLLPLRAAWIAASALLVMALPMMADSAIFDSRSLAWIGFARQPPPSNDYVPLFPWAGLTLLGMAATKAAANLGRLQWLHRNEPEGPLTAFLGFLGRYSLIIYLAHQPVMLAVLVPLADWLG